MRRCYLVVSLGIFLFAFYGCNNSATPNLTSEDHLAKGKEYFSSNEFDKSLLEFKEAVKLNPYSSEAHYFLGHSYQELWSRSFEAASRKYLESTAINPKEVPKKDMQRIYAFYGEKRELKELAIKEFKETVRLDPDNWGAQYLIAVDYENKGFFDEAITHYKDVVRINPKYSNAYSGMGSAYFNKGLYDLAIDNFKKAIAVDPDFDHAYYELGLTYLRINDKKRAIEIVKKLKTMNSIYYERLKNEIY